MSKSLLLNTVYGGSAGNGTYYRLGLAGRSGTAGGTTVEADHQMLVRVAGTVSLLGVRADAIGTSRAVRLRKNGANGNLVVNPTDSTAGVYEDQVNSDAVVDGDLINFGATNAVAAPTYQWMRAAFEASSDHASLWASSMGTGSETHSSAGGTVYTQNAGQCFLTLSETIAKYKVRVAGTFKNLRVLVTANSRSTTTTIKFRKNTADGNQVISVLAGVTGWVEDASNTDSVASGDDVAVAIINGSGSGGFSYASTQAWFVNTSNAKNDLCAYGNTMTFTASATPSFMFFAGAPANPGTIEADRTIRHGFDGTMSRLRGYVSSNTCTGTATLSLRKNTAAGNQTIAIGAGLTGFFEDASNADTFVATDDIALQIVGGTANSLGFRWVGVTEQWTAPSFTGTAPLTESGDTFAGTAAETFTGTAPMTEAGDSFVAAATSENTGALASTEAGDSFASSGTERFIGTMGASEASDLFAGSVPGPTTGTAAFTESSDTMLGAGGGSVTGAMASTEGSDAMAAAGGGSVTGTGAFVESADTFFGSTESRPLFLSAFADETDDVWLVLLTIEHADLTGPIRVVNNTEDIDSQGNTFSAFPFDIAVPDAKEGTPPRARLTIDNVAREIGEAIRTITSAPTVTIQIIRASAPNVIEVEWPFFVFRSITWNASTVTGDLMIEDFMAEPYPAGLFTPANFPGLI